MNLPELQSYVADPAETARRLHDTWHIVLQTRFKLALQNTSQTDVLHKASTCHPKLPQVSWLGASEGGPFQGLRC